ncbi:MAG: hypothetical protein HYZ08_00715 [Candidatus Kerfeldbacteria bacterium]|nr:hypothetical protein [Candidatus Kerfeldbacteria bacterium]
MYGAHLTFWYATCLDTGIFWCLRGRKQVYRAFRQKTMIRDCIGLENERGLGTPLLRLMIRNGALTYSLPHIDEIRNDVRKHLKILPKKYFDIHRDYVYPVTHSKKLRALMQAVRRQELEQYENAPGVFPGR